MLLLPIRQLLDALIANDSPRQVAWGTTIGMVLGLVPKDNMIVLALGTLLCALRVNRSAGLAAAGLFTMIGPSLDSITHLVGRKLLTEPLLEPLWGGLYELPLGPWIGFHNTVVLGSLLLGIYCSYPCYWTTLVFWRRYQSQLAAHVVRYRVTRWVAGASIAQRLGG